MTLLFRLLIFRAEGSVCQIKSALTADDKEARAIYSEHIPETGRGHGRQ